MSGLPIPSPYVMSGLPIPFPLSPRWASPSPSPWLLVTLSGFLVRLFHILKFISLFVKSLRVSWLHKSWGFKKVEFVVFLEFVVWLQVNQMDCARGFRGDARFSWLGSLFSGFANRRSVQELTLFSSLSSLALIFMTFALTKSNL